MLISFNWLKQHVQLPDSITPQEVAHKLTMSTVEVEKVTPLGAELGNIVVGKILAADKHPHADKLQLCQVDIGHGAVPIVCGGSNVALGMLVAVALPGARVRWHGQGEPINLEKTTIRGMESTGMICAADEIGLAEQFPKKEIKEILDLTAALSLKREGAPGIPLAQALGLDDVILEVDNKSLSNRPDLLGHYGVAREVAALFNREVLPYAEQPIAKGKGLSLKVSVENSALCPRYIAVAVNGIKVGESPHWLKTRLAAIGVRSINNIVDITNYVMFDIGQPTHAFDTARLNSKLKSQKSKHIIVRAARPEEKITTLDGVERILDPAMLVIADEEKPIAIAGVMGGQASSITKDTTTVIFESATFDAVAVRTTSARLGLRTDSASRFEKFLDPLNAERALKKLVELTLQVCPTAHVASVVADVKNFRLLKGPIEIPVEFFAAKIGQDIPLKTASTYLQRLGFGVKETKRTLLVTVPSWRATKDITGPEDIVEEVLRMWGYDQVVSHLPSFPITPPAPPALQNLDQELITIATREFGFTEAYNYSFVSQEQIERLGESVAAYLELDNPLSAEKPFLRRSLLPNLLENIRTNSEWYNSIKLAEVGQVYWSEAGGPRVEPQSDELLPRQDTWFTAVVAEKNNAVPFFEARRIVERLSERMNITLCPLEPDRVKPYQHSGRVADIRVGEQSVGALYELHPAIAQAFKLEWRIAVLELNISALAELGTVKDSSYAAVPIYPAVVRDLAFTLDSVVAHAPIAAAIVGSDPLVKKVELFDVFSGKGIPAGQKSMAYRITYLHLERTLATAEVEAAEKKIINLLTKKFNIAIR